MLTSLLYALCAVVLSAGEITAPADTLINYIINDQAVSNFDGSQLCGKVVNQYRIVENKVGNQVIKTHLISTFTPNYSTEEIKVAGDGEMNGEKPQIIVHKPNPDTKIMYIIDDKPATEEQFSKLSPSDIKSIEILKGDAATMLSGDKNTGVLKICTKASK